MLLYVVLMYINRLYVDIIISKTGQQVSLPVGIIYISIKDVV